jgi:hypothetical protein
LSAFNLPAIKVSHDSLDFGICPPMESRSITFAIKNLLPIESTTMILLIKNEVSHIFQVLGTQITIASNQERHFTVTASPEVEGTAKTDLFLVAHGGQVVRLKMTVHCGESIKVLDSKINFGPTDIFFEPAERKLDILNNDKKNRVPISYSCSTPEVELNGGEALFLEPGELKSIPIRFTSNFTGSREEILSIFAPNSRPNKVLLRAFSGPSLYVPIHTDIYFPAARVGETSYVRIPFTNVLNEQINIAIYFTSGVPIKLNLLPYAYSNKNTGQFEISELSNEKIEGLKIIMNPFSTAVVEVAFQCIASGMYKLPLTVVQSRPKKMEICVLKLHCAIFDESSLSATLQNSSSFYKFYQKPYLIPLTKISLFDITTKIQSQQTVSEMFKLTPSLQTIYGNNNPHRLTETLQFFHLINQSSASQKYKIVLSTHFKTDIPLEGEIPASSFLDIPIRFDPDFTMDSETKHFTSLGCITVLDGNFRNPGMVNAQIIGVVGELMTFEVRNQRNIVRLPRAQVMESSSRKILIRNKASCTLDCVFKVKGTSENTTHDSFVTSNKQIRLIPYEIVEFEISLQPSSQGIYNGELMIEYENSESNFHRDSKNEGETRTLGPLCIECQVGHPAINCQPSYLEFGEFQVGDSAMQNLKIENEQNLEAMANIAFTENFEKSSSLVCCEPYASSQAGIIFAPKRPSRIQQNISFAIEGKTHSIPIIATAGTLHMRSTNFRLCALGNIENLDGIVPLPENIFEIGDIAIGSEKKINLLIWNSGSLDVNVVKIASSDSSFVAIGRKPEGYIGSYSEISAAAFGPENIDQLEIDIDNNYYSTLSSLPLPDYLRPRHSILPVKKNSVRVENFRKYSQMFHTPILSTVDESSGSNVRKNAAIDNFQKLFPQQNIEIQATIRPDASVMIL